MKKRLALPVLAILLAAAAAGGWYWWTELRFLETTDNAYVEGDLSIISPRIAGYVASIEVEENRPVRRGDVLVRLDDRDLRARVAETAAAVRSKAAAIATADSERRVQATRVREAEASLASATAQATWGPERFRALQPPCRAPECQRADAGPGTGAGRSGSGRRGGGRGGARGRTRPDSGD